VPGRPARATPELTLLSWNVAGRVARLSEQVERVASVGADVVCLQEVTPRTRPLWEGALREQGYGGVAVAEAEPVAAGGRPLAVLTASREPADVVPVGGLPLPERVLAVRLAAGTEVVNVHSPISRRPELAKVLTHEAVRDHLARPAGHRRLVCGDLNTPRKEHPDGRIWTFARDQWGRLRPERGERWDEAELSLLRGLEPHGFRDAFRARHGYERRELSWEWPRYAGGYRLDHLIVSPGFEVLTCEYAHDWRRAGLSDHSPLIGALALEPGG
jgi:exonuclease III